MGQESSSHSIQPSDKFKSAFKRIADVAQYPTCANFWMYKEKIRPILEQIIGDEQIKQSLKVQRSDMYAAAMSHYKGRVSNVRRGSGSIRHESLMILFDDCGVHNYDGGGFRREFHSAFFQTALRDTGLFVGNYPRLVPNYTQDRLDDLTALGIGIVEAILNFDCGFPYLNPGLYYFMAGNEDFEQYLLVDDIPNPAVKHVVNQLLECETNDEINDVIQSEEGAIVNHIGWPTGKKFNIQNREQLIHMLTRHSIIDERRPAIDALRKGLNFLNFFDRIKDHTSLMEPLFIYSAEYSINKEYLKEILLPALENLKPADEKQQKAKEYAIQSVKEINDDEAKALYHFITGLCSPTVGQEQLSAEFMSNPKQKLPESMTCFQTLRIPVGNKDFHEFKDSFQHTIQTCNLLATDKCKASC
ncbi:uncharacterized protein LOC111109321 [Crassostrea virginica]|uniref:Uncharacterized protein LOC111109321 n=1 Tax=Crassostrea virginica TaxID=6565 RepID=A0A8B8BCG6_CRAVI|nr:uncharacterized protein LOC111109321 [Crassostrea virginica]XP_022301118.1 uncharacterized protein LOC111109321 [Crassostrea virginica]